MCTAYVNSLRGALNGDPRCTGPRVQMQAAPNNLFDAPDAIRHASRWWHASESTVPEPAAKKRGDQEQSSERWDRQRCHSQVESEIGQWRAGPDYRRSPLTRQVYSCIHLSVCRSDVCI